MYLGNCINNEINIKHEIANKMQEVRATWLKLDPYWKATNASKKWQLIIYDAIVRSKLLYGLETLHLTQAVANKIDAFQMRGLRKILKIPPTFVDRRNTNKKVLEEATKIAYNAEGDHRQVRQFSVVHSERKAKLLGHIARCGTKIP